MVKKILLVAITAALFGCSSSDTNVEKVSSSLKDELSSFDLTQEELDGYARSKGIIGEPGARYDRSVKVFAERNAMAAIILDESEIDSAELRAQLKESRNEILIKHYMAQHIDTAITAKTVETAYKQNLEQYTKRKAKVSHILLTVSPANDASRRMQQMEKAKQLAEQLRKEGGFEQAVKVHSDDAVSIKSGGDLGWVVEGGVRHAFASVAVKLETGEVSDPFETPQGIHIIKVIEGPVSEVTPFDQVKDKLEYKLRYDAKVKELERLKDAAAPMVVQSLK